MEFVNKNITRLKEKKLKIFTWQEINKLLKWIFQNKKKPSYISVKSKPLTINFYFLWDPNDVTVKPTGILLEYFSLKEFNYFLESTFSDKNNIKNNSQSFQANENNPGSLQTNKYKEAKNKEAKTNKVKYKEILRFTKNNYKTIYAETGPKINLSKEIKSSKLKNFWIAKNNTSLKPTIVIIDCEMIEIIDPDPSTTDKIKTINLEHCKTKNLIKTKKAKISSKLKISDKYYEKEEYKKHVARVTMIDIKGNILLDEYILPDYFIINFHTTESGITKESLKNAISLKEMYEKIEKIIFSDTILVGHAMANDL